MIVAVTASSFDALAARLMARANAIAEIRALQAKHDRLRGAQRWRRAEWLWPGFARG